METMYVLNWYPDDTNTDTYGAKISYQNDGSVHYQNELQPAGKKIHWWETHFFGDPDPLKASRYGSKRLPQIPRDQTFSLIFRGEAITEKSVGLTVRSFSKSGQLLDQQMTLSSELTFQLDDEVQDYEVSLVKFNNTELLFKGLLMIPEKMTKHYQIKANLAHGYIDFLPQKLDKVNTGQIMVRQIHRVVDAIPLPEQQTKIPIRVILINDTWDATQLQKIGNDFKNQFQVKDIDWSASDLKAQALLNQRYAGKLERK